MNGDVPPIDRNNPSSFSHFPPETPKNFSGKLFLIVDIKNNSFHFTRNKDLRSSAKEIYDFLKKNPNLSYKELQIFSNFAKKNTSQAFKLEIKRQIEASSLLKNLPHFVQNTLLSIVNFSNNFFSALGNLGLSNANYSKKLLEDIIPKAADLDYDKFKLAHEEHLLAALKEVADLDKKLAKFIAYADFAEQEESKHSSEPPINSYARLIELNKARSDACQEELLEKLKSTLDEDLIPKEGDHETLIKVKLELAQKHEALFFLATKKLYTPNFGTSRRALTSLFQTSLNDALKDTILAQAYEGYKKLYQENQELLRKKNAVEANAKNKPFSKEQESEISTLIKLIKRNEKAIDVIKPKLRNGFQQLYQRIFIIDENEKASHQAIKEKIIAENQPLFDIFFYTEND